MSSRTVFFLPSKTPKYSGMILHRNDVTRTGRIVSDKTCTLEGRIFVFAAPLPPIVRPGCVCFCHRRTWEIGASSWNPRVPLPPDDPHQHRRFSRFAGVKLFGAFRSPWNQKFWKTPRGGLGSARFSKSGLHVALPRGD